MKKRWIILFLIVLILAAAFIVHYIFNAEPTDSALFWNRWYLTDDYDTFIYEPRYEFSEIYYCFNKLGGISATITNMDGKTETRDFTYYWADGKNISIGGCEGTYTIKDNTLQIYFSDGTHITLTCHEEH